MRKTNGQHRKLTPITIAFLIVALLFLAIGLGTLGSTRTTGEDYELKMQREGDAQVPSVVFSLTSSVSETYVDENGATQTRTVSLKLVDILVNASAIYSEVGTPAGIAAERSSSATQYWSSKLEGTLENIYTAPTTNKDGEEEIVTPSAPDALYNYTHPFTFPSAGWRISTYRYVRLMATTHDIRLNEIVFIGMDVNDASNTTRYVVPAVVNAATPDVGETNEQARIRATALLDSSVNEQAVAYSSATAEEREKIGLPQEPEYPQSSFYRYSKEEIYSLLTLTEMRVGGNYSVDADGVDTHVYNGDRVYNTLGVNILALGTLIFGNSPFGLRFFPMLASFGVLVLGYLLVKQLTKSERAGLVFAVLYALCNLSFALGHLGTPLMIGVFFFTLALFLCHRFYAKGMKHANIAGVLPLFCAGIAGAAAICVNGVFVIPMVGVVAVYALALVRQQQAKKYYLDAALAELEAEEASAPEVEEGTAPAPSKAKKKVARVVNEYRYKNLAAAVGFPVTLLLGTLIFSVLLLLPVYYPLVKLYDNPVSPTVNLFALAWKAFSGGFVGVNQMGDCQSAWSIFYTLFTGTGERYAVTVAVINGVAAVLGLLGIVYAIYRLVVVLRRKEQGKEEKAELRRVLVPLCGLVLALVSAAFGGGALGFILLAYVFAFILAAQATEYMLAHAGKPAKITAIIALVLLIVCFLLFAVLTFSIPLSAEFMTGLFG